MGTTVSSASCNEVSGAVVVDALLAKGLRPRKGALILGFNNIDAYHSFDPRTPFKSRIAEVYEAMLSYNLLWRATGGLRMALTGRGGTIVQLVDLAGDEINARQIATIAVNMADLTRIWRAYLETGGGDVSLPEPFDLSTAIRA